MLLSRYPIKLFQYFKLHLFSVLAGALCFSAFTHDANAALTASTANVIKGSAPYFLWSDSLTELSNTDELLGFTLPDGLGGNGITRIVRTAPTQVVIVPTTVTLNKINPILKPDTGGYRPLNNLINSGVLKVVDDDGDATLSTQTSALGEIRINLKRNGILIPPMQSRLDPCSSYILEIEINPTGDPLTAKTAYGYPDKREYTGNYSATYVLVPARGSICIASPQDKTMQVSGANAYLWIEDKGFSIPELTAAGRDFPLTGFPNAKLSLLGAGDYQSEYVCQLANPAVDSAYLTLSSSVAGTVALGQGYELTYTGKKIDKPIQIDMYHNANLTTPIGSYTIPIAKLWAAGSSKLRYNSMGVTQLDPDSAFTGEYLAANYLAASESFFKRNELTNAEKTKAGYYYHDGTSWLLEAGDEEPVSGGTFTRDADGTFMGEWGSLQTYAASPWSDSERYWVNMAKSPTLQYTVDTDGKIDGTGPLNPFVLAICKR